MSILAWLVLGLIAGWIGSMIINRRGEGLLLDIVLGVIGAFVGGFLFNMFGAAGVSGLNLYSMLVAVIGSIVVLVIYHALVRRRSY
jgi:uncharacterized membrane protein YeaQ/YmgE (transglycosylase-associated protein family)